MSSQYRSTQVSDLKDMGQQQSTSGKHNHLLLATFSTLVLLAVYIVINTPSASTGEFNETGQPQLIVSNTVQDQSKSGNHFPEPIIAFPSTIESGSGLNIDSSTSAIQAAMQMSVEFDSKTAKDVAQSQPWINVTVKKGDTLSQLFTQNDLPARLAYAIAELDEARPLLKIRPGDKINLKKTIDGELALLRYRMNQFETLTLQPVESSFLIETLVREPEIRINNGKATIYNSLLGAADEVGISSSTMYEFIAMFGWQVDFAMDVRVGDQFSIIYEELFLDDKKVGDGEIVAAELILSGRKLQAVRHIDEEGDTNYYTADGGGVKGTFLRNPLKFASITSSYSKNRLHPIKKVWRAHKGVDYGAPRGTPIMATGDGTVRVSGRKNGYGKTVILRHGGKYDTVYAHLNGYAKGIHSGARVKQGQVIGYVGSTGLATGPHLHYEFRIQGVHKNPVTVELPKSVSIDKKYATQFKQRAKIWVAELDHLNRIPLAQN